MNMKRLLTLVAFFATLHASAQQVNPVPDYVFANRMSAGRNTVTDTAAYFSIGPRYGATRGMMPPMVVDTASFSANKRNGLLIFSVQKNKFLYWDSVGVKWAEMAGTAGTALTSADTAALLSTRAWRQKGIDSLAAIRIAGSGTTNYVPKFTSSTTIGNSDIRDSASMIGIGGSPLDKFTIIQDQNITTTARVRNNNSGSSAYSQFVVNALGNSWGFRVGSSAANSNALDIVRDAIGTPLSQMRFFTNGRISVNSTTDNGYTFDIFGSLRSTTGANFATTSGNVGIGTTNPLAKLVISNAGAESIEFGYSSGLTSNYFESTNRAGGTVDFTYYIGGSAAHRFYTAAQERMRVSSSGEILINTISDAGDYKLQVSGNIYNTGSITTGAPSGGSIKPWKIGEAATVSPTSPNRTLRVEVDGVVYYIHAKTTND